MFAETIIAVTAILIGGTIFIIPIAGLTARFAVKPLVEAWAKNRSDAVGDMVIVQLEGRVSLLEEQVQSLERDNARLLEEAEFQLRLREGEARR